MNLMHNRVACSKFGRPNLSSEFQNHALNVSGVGMPRTKLNPHSKAETISKLTVSLQYFQIIFAVQELEF